MYIHLIATGFDIFNTKHAIFAVIDYVREQSCITIINKEGIITLTIMLSFSLFHYDAACHLNLS